jgi:hypothetical protein
VNGKEANRHPNHNIQPTPRITPPPQQPKSNPHKIEEETVIFEKEEVVYKSPPQMFTPTSKGLRFTSQKETDLVKFYYGSFSKWGKEYSWRAQEQGKDEFLAEILRNNIHRCFTVLGDQFCYEVKRIASVTGPSGYSEMEKIKKIERLFATINIDEKDQILHNTKPQDEDTPYTFFGKLRYISKIFHGKNNAWGEKEVKARFHAIITGAKYFAKRLEWSALKAMVTDKCFKVFTLKDILYLILYMASQGKTANFYKSELYKLHARKLQGDRKQLSPLKNPLQSRNFVLRDYHKLKY